jgi:hypothetical protein
LFSGLGVTAGWAQSDQGIKDDVKDAGKATGRAAKKTAKKVKNGSKKVVNKSAEATEKGAHKVEQKPNPSRFTRKISLKGSRSIKLTSEGIKLQISKL